MEQHPIPQQISSYEFKLVGEMTLKQFLKAGGGIVIAFLINATGVVFFVRWPLMFLFGLGGLALAFVPFQDRPLETWLLSFIKSIYSPTVYTYKKRADKDWMEWQAKKKDGTEESEVYEEDATGRSESKSRLKDFIHSLPSSKKGVKESEKPEGKTEKVMEKGEKAIVEVREKLGENGKIEQEMVVKPDWRGTETNLDLKRQKLGATGEAVFGSIPMPSIPEIPNLLVGMVTDDEGKIVGDAIVEVQDMKGNPVRVLKTNPLGQFRTSTPLTDGKYLIITEKEGNEFNRINVDLAGRIVEPIKIRAMA